MYMAPAASAGEHGAANWTPANAPGGRETHDTIMSSRSALHTVRMRERALTVEPKGRNAVFG